MLHYVLGCFKLFLISLYGYDHQCKGGFCFLLTLVSVWNIPPRGFSRINRLSAWLKIYLLKIIFVFFISDSSAFSSSNPHAFQINFNSLYTALCEQQRSDQATLLLYMLLHQNGNVRTYVLARTDIENLVSVVLLALYTLRGAAPGNLGVSSFQCSPFYCGGNRMRGQHWFWIIYPTHFIRPAQKGNSAYKWLTGSETQGLLGRFDKNAAVVTALNRIVVNSQYNRHLLRFFAGYKSASAPCYV